MARTGRARRRVPSGAQGRTERFPEHTLRSLGIDLSGWANVPGMAWRSWRGISDPVLTRSSLPGNPEDRQARYIEAAVNGVLIASIYLPNGNPQPGPKFDYKLAWFERLITHADDLMAPRCAGCPGRRLQRRPDCAGYLSNAISRQQCFDPTSEPPGVSPDCWLRAGRMLCGNCTRKGRSGRSGTISATGGRPTRECG